MAAHVNTTQERLRPLPSQCGANPPLAEGPNTIPDSQSPATGNFLAQTDEKICGSHGKLLRILASTSSGLYNYQPE
jgi:hypothetical protein